MTKKKNTGSRQVELFLRKYIQICKPKNQPIFGQHKSSPFTFHIEI
jgi:hypothetical protein